MKKRTEVSWGKVKENILEAIHKAIGTKTVDRDSRWETRTPLFTLEVKQKSGKKTAYMKFILSKTNKAYQNYRRVH